MRRYDLMRRSRHFSDLKGFRKPFRSLVDNVFLARYVKDSPGTIVDLDFSRWIVGKYGLVKKFPLLFPPLHYLLRSRSHGLYQQVSKNITTFSPRIAFYTRPNIFITKKEDKTSEKKEIYNYLSNVNLVPDKQRKLSTENALTTITQLPTQNTITKTSFILRTIIQKRAPFQQRVIKTQLAEREPNIQTNIVHVNTFQESLRRIKESVSDLEAKIDRSREVSPKNAQSSSPGMNGLPNASRESNIDVKYLTDQVYQMLERKIRVERERRGL